MTDHAICFIIIRTSEISKNLSSFVQKMYYSSPVCYAYKCIVTRENYMASVTLFPGVLILFFILNIILLQALDSPV